MGSRFELRKLRNGTFVLSEDGRDIAELEQEDADTLIKQGLSHLGYQPSIEHGLKVEDSTPFPVKQEDLAKHLGDLRQSGRRAAAARRPLLHGPWIYDSPSAAPTRPGSSGPSGAAGPRTRRFVKEVARPPEEKKPVPRQKTGKPGGTLAPSSVLDVQLFDDDRAQLRYEVRHFYLVTVPESQRQQWPLPAYTIQDSFLNDLAQVGGDVSKKQVLAAIVDVVTNRASIVNSREPRPLRETSGVSGNPVVTRADGATAWRANVSNVTAAARRIMWWKLTDQSIALARFSRHDDMEMPVR